MRMPKRKIKIWIEELRSGKWKKGTGTMQRDDRFCCLGVACKLFIPEDKLRFTEKGAIAGSLPDAQPGAPGWLRQINRETFLQVSKNLSSLNDAVSIPEAGYASLNFDEIADILQLIYIEEALS